MHLRKEYMMAIFVIADLHLDIGNHQKSMEIFGNRWRDYEHKIQKNWMRLVADGDTVIVPGDISWALTLEEVLPDLKWIDALPGRKLLMKGNHDFWWSTAAKMTRFLEENSISRIDFLNNNAVEVEDYILAGSRGWFTDLSMQNGTQTVDYSKIVNREVIRLRMSLECAKKLQAQSGKEIIAFFHFPPVWNEFCCEELIDVLLEYGIHRCYFGHIHSCYTVPSTFEFKQIRFQIISADYLDFIPQIL